MCQVSSGSRWEWPFDGPLMGGKQSEGGYAKSLSPVPGCEIWLRFEDEPELRLVLSESKFALLWFPLEGGNKQWEEQKQDWDAGRGCDSPRPLVSLSMEFPGLGRLQLSVEKQ